MPKRSLRRISFPVHLSHILRDTWNIVLRDAGWRVKSVHGVRLIKTKMKKSFDSSTKVMPNLDVISLAVRDRQ